MLFILCGAAGLRISEALGLTLRDVDLPTAVIQIRESKFYKTRLVPLGADLLSVLTSYARKRKQDHSAQPDTPFLCLAPEAL